MTGAEGGSGAKRLTPQRGGTAMTGRELIEAARQAVPNIANKQLVEQLQSGNPVVILDVREKEEWDEGHIPQATLLSRGRLEGRVEQMVPDKSTFIVTH
jgi:rhodanese-related sulfurtransferase